MKKITVLGGGTGTFVVLSGIKSFPVNLAAIVTMMDSGGSTGRLRDQLGVLPPGDLRQCLVALSEASELWRKLFLYRFEHGDLEGHNFGNIFLSALEKVSANYDEVLDTVNYVLKTRGDVLPVTYQSAHITAKYESGTVIHGETHIDEGNTEKSRITHVYLEPKVKVNEKAIDRLKETDYLIVGPGDLYTSIIPVLLVEKVQSVISDHVKKVIYIMNLVTKTGQTTNYTANDHIQDITKYLGRKPDIVIMHTGKIDPTIVDWYHSHGQAVVQDNLSEFDGQIIRQDLVDRSMVQKSSADQLTRSILRHDSGKIAQVLKNLF